MTEVSNLNLWIWKTYNNIKRGYDGEINECLLDYFFTNNVTMNGNQNSEAYEDNTKAREWQREKQDNININKYKYKWKVHV